jgi:hypothetical protein
MLRWKVEPESRALLGRHQQNLTAMRAYDLTSKVPQATAPGIRVPAEMGSQLKLQSRGKPGPSYDIDPAALINHDRALSSAATMKD